MTTEYTQVGFEFHFLNHRQIRAQFDGGAISSDGGGLLLREVDKRTGIIRKFAACFTDYRDPERIRCMGRTEFPDPNGLRGEPWLVSNFHRERNGAYPSAWRAMFKKPLTPTGIVREAILLQQR